MKAQAITHGSAPAPLPGHQSGYARPSRLTSRNEPGRERAEPASHNRPYRFRGQSLWARDQLEKKMTQRQRHAFHFNIGCSAITAPPTEAKTIHGFPSVVLPSLKYPRARQHPSTRECLLLDQNPKDSFNASWSCLIASLTPFKRFRAILDVCASVAKPSAGSAGRLIELQGAFQPAAELELKQSLDPQRPLTTQWPPAETHRDSELVRESDQQRSPNACPFSCAAQSERIFLTTHCLTCPQKDTFVVVSLRSRAAYASSAESNVRLRPSCDRGQQHQTAKHHAMLEGRSAFAALRAAARSTPTRRPAPASAS